MSKNNRYKKLPLVFAFTMVLKVVYCQDFHYSNLHENLYFLNPSYINHIENSLLHFTYRNQWPENSDFVTYSGSFFYNFESLKSVAGVQLYRDNQGKGIITTTSFNILYGYHTQMFNNFSFSAGISGGYNVYAIDYSKLTFENGQIPVGNDKKNYPDFSVGIEFGILKQSFIGLSVSHLLSPEISAGNKIYRKYGISYQGIYNLSKPFRHHRFSLEPLLVASFQQQIIEILYGARLHYSSIIGGLYTRQNAKFNFDAFIIMLGISFGNNTLIYTYDINLSGADSRFDNLASHEVTFFHKFEYKKIRNKKGAIKCPEF